MPARLLVLHGPNLNLVTDLTDLDIRLEKKAAMGGMDLKTFQANSEGALVDALHAERTRLSGVIVNAAKLAPTAEVLAEAIALVKRPTIEIITDGGKQRSALKAVVMKQITGKGFDGYLQAIDVLSVELKKSANRPTGTMLPVGAGLGAPNATVTDGEETGPVSRDEVKKTLGRKPPLDDRTTQPIRKTIGAGRSDAAAAKTPEGGLSRAVVREKIGERLSGKLTPAGLATWARGQWQQLQRGAPVESGQRDQLEDVLQTLLLSASTKANDHMLIELMTQLG